MSDSSYDERMGKGTPDPCIRCKNLRVDHDRWSVDIDYKGHCDWDEDEGRLWGHAHCPKFCEVQPAEEPETEVPEPEETESTKDESYSLTKDGDLLLYYVWGIGGSLEEMGIDFSCVPEEKQEWLAEAVTEMVQAAYQEGQKKARKDIRKAREAYLESMGVEDAD